MIYLHIMRFILMILKLIAFLLLSSLFIAGILFFTYKDRIYEKVRIVLSNELSTLSGMHVNIGSIRYSPLNSIEMNYITLLPGEKSNGPGIGINKAVVNIDLASLLRNRNLDLSADIHGLRYKKISLNGTFILLSKPAEKYENITDPGLLDSISVIGADVTADDISIENISGKLDIRKSRISSGRLQTKFNGSKYTFMFKKKYGSGNIDIKADSDGFSADCSLALKDTEKVEINYIKGKYHTVYFDMKGTISDYMLSNRSLQLNGDINTDLVSLAYLPGIIGKTVKNSHIEGKLTAKLGLKINALSPTGISADADIHIRDLFINGLMITDISSVLTYKNGKIRTTRLEARLYKGEADSSAQLDILSEGKPFTLSTEIKNIDYNNLITNLSGKRTAVRGKLYMNIEMNGFLENSGSYKGKGNIAVINADLGTMPILTPLFGDLYAAFGNIIPGIKTTIINEASADFMIYNRKISTDDLLFLGDDIAISGTGYVDFDGNLNFDFEHKILEPENDKGWQTSLRNAIINLGKLIKQTHLEGTIKEPKWSI